ncbi:hypothetical protein BC835DRAFT_1308475 [Cytidiella melzeri]|nr:hypothetical protein BC835DRAFT_1308475 [Cytidiella melzeri]
MQRMHSLVNTFAALSDIYESELEVWQDRRPRSITFILQVCEMISTVSRGSPIIPYFALVDCRDRAGGVIGHDKVARDGLGSTSKIIQSSWQLVKVQGIVIGEEVKSNHAPLLENRRKGMEHENVDQNVNPKPSPVVLPPTYNPVNGLPEKYCRAKPFSL